MIVCIDYIDCFSMLLGAMRHKNKDVLPSEMMSDLEKSKSKQLKTLKHMSNCTNTQHSQNIGLQILIKIKEE